MTALTQKLVDKVRMAGFEDAAYYIESLTDEEKEKITFNEGTDDLWNAFEWLLTPQGNYFWRDIAYKVDSAATGRMTKPKQW